MCLRKRGQAMRWRNRYAICLLWISACQWSILNKNKMISLHRQAVTSGTNTTLSYHRALTTSARMTRKQTRRWSMSAPRHYSSLTPCQWSTTTRYGRSIIIAWISLTFRRSRCEQGGGDDDFLGFNTKKQMDAQNSDDYFEKVFCNWKFNLWRWLWRFISDRLV